MYVIKTVHNCNVCHWYGVCVFSSLFPVCSLCNFSVVPLLDMTNVNKSDFWLLKHTVKETVMAVAFCVGKHVSNDILYVVAFYDTHVFGLKLKHALGECEADIVHTINSTLHQFCNQRSATWAQHSKSSWHFSLLLLLVWGDICIYYYLMLGKLWKWGVEVENILMTVLDFRLHLLDETLNQYKSTIVLHNSAKLAILRHMRLEKCRQAWIYTIFLLHTADTHTACILQPKLWKMDDFLRMKCITILCAKRFHICISFSLYFSLTAFGKIGFSVGIARKIHHKQNPCILWLMNINLAEMKMCMCISFLNLIFFLF